jgi:hypothetical protein
VDDVRKYIHKFVDNNEIMFKNLKKVQTDFEKERSNAIGNSRSNNNLFIDPKESFNNLKIGVTSEESYVSKTPVTKNSNSGIGLINSIGGGIPSSKMSNYKNQYNVNNHNGKNYI